MADFAGKLAEIVAREMVEAKGDQDRMAGAIERLAAALGMTIALSAQGDRTAIDQLMTGAEMYAHEEAVSKARIIRMMQP